MLFITAWGSVETLSRLFWLTESDYKQLSAGIEETVWSRRKSGNALFAGHVLRISFSEGISFYLW
jgi:hypothetical protein